MKKILFVVMACWVIALSSYAGTTAVDEAQIFPNDWKKIKLKGLNLIRLKVPGGWLVREGLGKFAGLALDGQERKMIFVPDAEFTWLKVEDKAWQTLKLKGLNLYRLKLPQGWLIREGYGKLGSENQTLGMLYIDDANHSWSIKPRK